MNVKFNYRKCSVLEKLNTYSLQLSTFGFQHLAISGNSLRQPCRGPPPLNFSLGASAYRTSEKV